VPDFPDGGEEDKLLCSRSRLQEETGCTFTEVKRSIIANLCNLIRAILQTPCPSRHLGRIDTGKSTEKLFLADCSVRFHVPKSQGQRSLSPFSLK
jgi:hypothetical protein